MFIGLDYYWSEQGGAKIPIIRPPASQEKLPVLINVVTDPPGADLFLDGSPVKVVTIPPGDHGLHLIEARLGCLSAKKSISNVRGPETIKLALQPGYYTFTAETDPPGAEVFLDGQDTGKSTPLKLDREGCEPFTLAFVRKGWVRKEVRVEPAGVHEPEGIARKRAGQGDIAGSERLWYNLNLRRQPPAGAFGTVHRTPGGRTHCTFCG